jgi:integrase
MSPKTGEKSPVKGKEYPKEIYTSDEIRSVLARTSSSFPSAIRNHALIVLLWQTGLRISEALDLLPGDVDTVKNEVFVRKGKTGARRVASTPEVSADVERWMGRRSTLALKKNSPLFCSTMVGKQGKRLTLTYVESTFHRLATSAGVEIREDRKLVGGKRFHPHGLRHTYSVALAEANVPPAYLQRQLGHASLNTTTVYLAGISTEDIAEAIGGVTW